MADAFISCWHAKFQYCTERPVTYINQNIDPNWAPMIPTPPFPEYTSGHSVVSGAVSAILTAMLGKVIFTDTTYVSAGVPARTFNSFAQAAQEAAVSRLYGGIHYPLSIQLGVQQGQLIGQTIMDKLNTSGK
jgi:membrane-associated phospholipid phosphatase